MPQTLMGVVRWVTSPARIVARILPADDRELFNPAWLKFVIPTNPALELVQVTRPALTLPGQTRIVLYAQGDSFAACQFPDPGNWNPSANKIEVLGAGQPGKSGLGEPTTSAGGGGGGGAYAHGENVPVTFPVPYTVWDVQFAANPGQVCAWGINAGTGTPTGAPGIVYAGVAYGGVNTAPGSGGQAFYPAGFVGGNGGSGFSGSTNSPGGGGGGAAGPNGPGGNGGNATSVLQGAGGYANAGTTPGGSTASANGSTGSEWGPNFGCGSGGAGAILNTNNGGGGAFFGGGGGGGAQPPVSGGPGGGGSGGLIVITYTPVPSGMQAQVIA